MNRSDIPESDTTIFLQYELQKGGNIVAVFNNVLSQSTFVLNKISTKLRLETLKSQFLPYEETQKALDYWPDNWVTA